MKHRQVFGQVKIEHISVLWYMKMNTIQFTNLDILIFINVFDSQKTKTSISAYSNYCEIKLHINCSKKHITQQKQSVTYKLRKYQRVSLRQI